MPTCNDKSMTIDQLAECIGAVVQGDGSAVVQRCVGIEEAGPEVYGKLKELQLMIFTSPPGASHGI